jgi:hypothetical protein
MLANRRFDVRKHNEPLPNLTQTEHWIAHQAWFNTINSRNSLLPAILSLLPLQLIHRYCIRYTYQLWQQAFKWLQELKEKGNEQYSDR